MKPFTTAPLEQESESSTIVFLVLYAGKTECSKIYTIEIFYMYVHILLHLLNEMRKIDNM